MLLRMKPLVLKYSGISLYERIMNSDGKRTVITGLFLGTSVLHDFDFSPAPAARNLLSKFLGLQFKVYNETDSPITSTNSAIPQC